MKYVKSQFATVGFGACMGMPGFLLAVGEKVSCLSPVPDLSLAYLEIHVISTLAYNLTYCLATLFKNSFLSGNRSRCQWTYSAYTIYTVHILLYIAK